MLAADTRFSISRARRGATSRSSSTSSSQSRAPRTTCQIRASSPASTWIRGASGLSTRQRRRRCRISAVAAVSSPPSSRGVAATSTRPTGAGRTRQKRSATSAALSRRLRLSSGTGTCNSTVSRLPAMHAVIWHVAWGYRYRVQVMGYKLTLSRASRRPGAAPVVWATAASASRLVAVCVPS